MGKTNPTQREALDDILDELERGLRRRDRQMLKDLLDDARGYYDARPVPACRQLVSAAAADCTLVEATMSAGASSVPRAATTNPAADRCTGSA